jgi:small ligand-binding sensory domain FIST
MDDGASAGRVATRLALEAAQAPSAELIIVFAGARHGADEFAGVIGAALETAGGAAAIVGCSTTGIITGANEIENASAVGVLVLAGAEALPAPIFQAPIRDDPREAGLRLGQAARARLRAATSSDDDGGDGGVAGAMLVVLADPHRLDATAFANGIAEGAPGLVVVGAGASGRQEADARVFARGRAVSDAAVAFVIPRGLFPTVGTSHGCQGVSEPLTITAVEHNVILEIDGRPAVDVLREVLELPGNRPLEKLSVPLLAGIGDRMCDGRSDYVVRPFVIPEDDPRTLAVPEPVHTGQTIRFTLRDAISAREDMKVMLEEQATVRAQAQAPSFALFFNCAGRGSALYGQSGLDPELIRRRFGELPLIGIESTFEIAPTCGRPQVHMLTGVLVLAGALLPGALAGAEAPDVAGPI